MYCKSPVRDDMPVMDFGRLCGKKLIVIKKNYLCGVKNRLWIDRY
jgi:hypothetical protein